MVTYLGREIALIEPSTAVSENPTVTIPLRATGAGQLKVTFVDSRGVKLKGTAEVKVT